MHVQYNAVITIEGCEALYSRSLPVAQIKSAEEEVSNHCPLEEGT